MRVVDQLIEYAREHDMLSAEHVERLEASGFIKKAPDPAQYPEDGRWTERHWNGFVPDYSWTWEGDLVIGQDETDEAVGASRSGQRELVERRERLWTARRGKRVRRELARAWRQPDRKGDQAKAA